MSQSRTRTIDSRTLILTAVIAFGGMLLAIVASLAVVMPIVQSQMQAYAQQNTVAAHAPATAPYTYQPAAPAGLQSGNNSPSSCAAPQEPSTASSTPPAVTTSGHKQNHNDSIKKILRYSVDAKIHNTVTNVVNNTNITNTATINSNNTIGSHNNKTEVSVTVKDSFNKDSYNKNSNNVAIGNKTVTNVNSFNRDDHSITNNTTMDLEVNHNSKNTLVNSGNTTVTKNDIETNINSKNDIDITKEVEINKDSKNVQVGAFQDI